MRSQSIAPTIPFTPTAPTHQLVTASLSSQVRQIQRCAKSMGHILAFEATGKRALVDGLFDFPNIPSVDQNALQSGRTILLVVK